MDNHNIKLNLSQYKELFQEISTDNPIWKVALYVRLSKDDGNSVSLSVVNQIKKMARFLRTFEDFEIYDIYIDDGLTGTDFERTEYMRMQEDIVNKDVNCLIVKDLTRYARNIADGIKELDSYVLEHKIRFISLDYPKVDTFKNPKAISSAEVYDALKSAEDLSRITSQKVRDIKEIKREDGEKNGGFPPYGYLPNPDGEHWIIDPVASEIVHNMFKWSAEGMSDREIAKKLNSLGVLNPTAYKKSIGLKYYNPCSEKNSGLWWPTTVKYILEDKNHIGCSVQGKSSSFDHKRHKQIKKKKDDYVIISDCHEKSIPDDLFYKVSKVRSQRTRVSKNTGKVHMFANLVYCATCNIAMKKTSAKGHNYLVCRTYKDAGIDFCTGKRSINYETLEKIVLKTIQTQINLIANLQMIVEKINQKPVISNQSIRINSMLQNIQQELVHSERLIDESYYDWKNDDISKEQYQRIRKETEEKLENLRSNIRALQIEQKKINSGIKSNNEYFERFLKYRNIESLDRLILLELIQKIYINEDKSIKIEFNFENQYMLILDFIEQNNMGKEIQKLQRKKI